MRNIKDALNLLKEIDPNTSLTYYSIKKMCDMEFFKVVKVGKMYLLNFDELLEYLHIDY